MKIGINGVSVVTGGNITYFANLLPALTPLLEREGHQLVVYTRQGGSVVVPQSPAFIERKVAPQITSRQRVIWDQTALPKFAREDKLDVFYGPTDNVPLAITCKLVCAYRNPNVYAPLASAPTWKRPRLAALRSLAIASALRSARGIFVSAVARDEIVPVLHMDPAKARVVHHGIGEVFRQAVTGANPWNRPYLLMVSTLYHYKNTVRLIEAYEKHIHRRGLPHGLAIVGAPVEPEEAAAIRATIERLGLKDHVLMAGECRYPAVGAWYKHASAFIFPSWRETFGHPLLEAMAADLPVAAADIPVMREIGGNVARYFDPYSIDAIGEGILDVLDDSKRAARVALGNARLGEFTWQSTARKTLDVLVEAGRS